MNLKLLLFISVSQMAVLRAANHQEEKLDALTARPARSVYRRLPVYGLDEVPRDSRENCQAYCYKLYSKLLENSLYFQACIGVCASINECSTVADCVGGTVCINTAEDPGYLCQCPPGFTGDGRLSGDGCIDIDECSSEPERCVSEANCSNTEGSFICQCPFGFNGDGRSNGNGCTDITAQFVLLINTQIDIRISEAVCSLNGDADCVPEATCIDSTDGDRFICACPSGLMGDGRISGSGCMANECSTIADCAENTSCIDSIDGFVCLCPPGFIGDGRINGSNCVPDECSTVADCSVLAFCSNTIDGFVCTCRPGYEGDGRIGGIGCIDIDECADNSTNDCVPEAMCFNTEGSFICICPPSRNDTNGREGEGCFAAVSIPECGPGEWYSVISLNMSDPDQSCPPNWQERTSPVRTCERPEDATNGCTIGFEETVSRPFTRVAGSAIGYQVGTPEAFARTIVFGSANLESVYADGMSITYSSSVSPTNNHIWTFAVGVTETRTDRFGCPCSTGMNSNLPDFLQNSYFCESAASSIISGMFYDDDPLWDGEDCEGQCCTGSFATVPTFCTTTEKIEDATIRVRLCTDEPTTNENIAIESLEIFIQ